MIGWVSPVEMEQLKRQILIDINVSIDKLKLDTQYDAGARHAYCHSSSIVKNAFEQLVGSEPN